MCGRRLSGLLEVLHASLPSKTYTSNVGADALARYLPMLMRICDRFRSRIQIRVPQTKRCRQ